MNVFSCNAKLLQIDGSTVSDASEKYTEKLLCDSILHWEPTKALQNWSLVGSLWGSFNHPGANVLKGLKLVELSLGGSCQYTVAVVQK